MFDDRRNRLNTHNEIVVRKEKCSIEEHFTVAHSVTKYGNTHIHTLPVRFSNQESAIRTALGIVDGLKSDRQPASLVVDCIGTPA